MVCDGFGASCVRWMDILLLEPTRTGFLNAAIREQSLQTTTVTKAL